MINRALSYYFMILVVIALFTVQSKSANSAIPFLTTPSEQQPSALEPSSSSAQTIITKTYSIGLFPIRYAITGNGNILHTISWENRNTLSINIGSKSNGKLIIELPRELIDSPQVFVDGIHVPAKQTTINSKVRTLVVDFHKDSSKIEIQTAAATTSRPDIKGPSITEKTPMNNVNSLTKRIDYSILCTRLQPVIVQPCHILVSTNGSLTSQGIHAMHCIRDAILLSGDTSSWAGVPLSTVLNGLSMLAPPAGCDGVLKMQEFSQLGNIGSLTVLIQQLSNLTNNSSGIPINGAAPTGSGNNGNTLSASKINNFSTYENVTYGISSIQYPDDWKVGKINAPAKDISLIGKFPNDRSVFNIVSFYPPIGSYPSRQHPPSVSISINFPGDPHFVTSLSEYLNHTIYIYANGFTYDTTFQHMSSNATSKLAGFPAYSLKYSDINNDDKSSYTALELGTIISGKVIFVVYSANSPSFSTFLSTALKMIGSLRLNEHAIEQVTTQNFK
jgi:hypothetical protein